jgi:hypothetical protein
VEFLELSEWDQNGEAGMKMHCVLCGRPMQQAAMYIGHMPVGSTCAKNAGLLEKARKCVGALKLGKGRRTPIGRTDDQLALDLCGGEEA